MAPRVRTLIIVGTVVYVSLSLYHWRQVKKIPVAERPNSVRSVLTREPQEKSWVQVTTSPRLSAEDEKNSNPVVPAPEIAQTTKQPTTQPTDQLPGTSQLAGDEAVTSPGREYQSLHNESIELQKALQYERSINLSQSQKLNDQQARIVSLQSKLDDTSALLQEKNIVVEELKKQTQGHAGVSGETGPETRRIQVLYDSLASKLAALAKANERITGLAELLDRSSRTLTKAENDNAHLQRVLSNTENALIKERQEAGKLNDEIIRTKEEREKYLSETGRLHTQLQQAKVRLTWFKNELNKARLTSEAMLHYGQEQTELTTPFRQQIEVLNARIEDKNSDLLKSEEQISQLRNQELALQDKIQSLQLALEKNSVTSKEFKKTSQSLDKAQKHSAELVEQLKVMADQLNARDTMIANMNRELAQAQTATQNAAQQTDVLTKEAERRLQELDTVNQSLAETKQQLESGTVRQKAMAAELRKAVTVNKKLAGKIAEQEKQLAEAKNALGKSQATLKELKTIQKTATEATAARDKADETIKQLQKALAVAKTRHGKADAEIQKLTKSLAEAKRKQTDDTITEKLRQEIDQLRKTIADHNKQQKTMDKIMSELKAENNSLQKKISEAENSSRKSEEFKSAFDRKTRELTERQNRMITLENTVDEVRAELDRRETAFFNMQEEFTSLQDKYGTLQKERDALLLSTRDSDNDTISDAEDTCPDTIQGADVGPDGCERDSDGDGLVDRLDLCPDSPEKTATNQYGCAKDAHIILSGVYFSGGSADLSPSSQKYLNKVAGVLKLYKDASFEVSGHTDSTGENPRNLKVSQQRAEAVRNYLVKNGIGANHLVAMGYGSNLPVADNATPGGRAANRRVELKIISPIHSPSTAEKSEPATTAKEQGLPVQ